MDKQPYLWFDTDQESWSYDKPLRPTYIPLFQHAEAEEAETLRPLVLKFAGAAIPGGAIVTTDELIQHGTILGVLQ